MVFNHKINNACRQLQSGATWSRMLTTVYIFWAGGRDQGLWCSVFDTKHLGSGVPHVFGQGMCCTLSILDNNEAHGLQVLCNTPENHRFISWKYVKRENTQTAFLIILYFTSIINFKIKKKKCKDRGIANNRLASNKHCLVAKN